MLTERQVRYIIARAEYTCQYEGCTNPASLVQLQYPIDELLAFHRDPNAPDNYCAICTTHAPQEGS